MAVPANFDSPERDKFRYCFTRLLSFVYKDDDSTRTDLNLLLDQINSLEYSSILVREQDGNRLLTKLCSVIPLHDERLVIKMSQITNNLKRKQMLTLADPTLDVVVDYFIKAIQRCPAWARPDILRAFAAVLYENCDKVTQFHESLLGKQGIFVQLINDNVTDTDTLKEAIFCMESLTVKPTSSEYLSAAHIDVCIDVFIMLLHKMPSTSLDQMAQCKILINCLRGIQNILQVTRLMPVDKLGVGLAAVRAYLFYGLYSRPTVIPESLYPSPLTKQDLPSLGKHTSDTPGGKPHTDKEDTSGTKKSKRKTKKKSDKRNEKKESLDKDDCDTPEIHHDTSQDATVLATLTPSLDQEMKPSWARISSSESEWSDTEGGQASKLRSNCTKVRQCALSCFYWIVKTTDKKLMFSYWSSFIPDSQSTSNTSNTQTLFTIILKDPSPKCRMGALAALSVLVDGTKLLLSAAEDVEDKKPATFTPFSVILGSIVKEMHRCLLLAMVSEDYPITLTQLIKCFGTVISNVPYHRMRPGLLSRIVKQVRAFINHRDPNVRVACLTCFGAMAKIQPPLMEVCHIIHPTRPPVTARLPSVSTESGQTDNTKESDSGASIGRTIDLDSGFSSSPNVASQGLVTDSQGTSGGTTPKSGAGPSPGVQTPVYSDQLLQSHAREISWVVRLCVKNILPQSGSGAGFGFEEPFTEPLPVRLESLQVLANLTKGYFPFIRFHFCWILSGNILLETSFQDVSNNMSHDRIGQEWDEIFQTVEFTNCVPLLQELVHHCYRDKDPVIKLHTAKLLDEFTQVLLQDLQNKEESKVAVERLDKQQVLEFWLSLLSGPVQEILQNPSHGAVRATTCDCIANIGDEVFTALPVGKRVLCLTVVLGLTSDEDRFIRASAIRTLGVYALYKSLREDVSFITDATTAILGAMDDKTIAVRVKTAWSLANLCDALALNREDGDLEFLAEFPDMLALNVITMATRACLDNDKIKANGVRALGNILRFLSAKSLGKETFVQAVAEGVRALVKNVGSGAMKVRWNACYAISNMYKNIDLNSGATKWNENVLDVLCNVVKDCKNFKVRINAAIALASPRQRSQYGAPAAYVKVWAGVIQAFNTAEDIADFIDYRYRDTLIEQICTTVLHLTTLLQLGDLDPLLSVLQASGDQLVTHMDRYFTSRPKEHKDTQLDSHLSQAKANLDLLGTSGPTDVQSACLDILTSLCLQLATAKEEEDEMWPYPKPKFAPTYN